jgi:hypothetical protein
MFFNRCFNGGICIDGVDKYLCECPDGVTGQNCECPAEAVEDPALCLNVNESVSWTLPPRDVLFGTTTIIPEEEETTTLSEDELTNRLDSEVSFPPEADELILEPEIHSSLIYPTAAGGILPTSTIVYNFSDPVTSVYIYEVSSSDLVTRSFLAGNDYVIKTSPLIMEDDMGKTIKIVGVQSRNKCSLWNVERKEWRDYSFS